MTLKSPQIKSLGLLIPYISYQSIRLLYGRSVLHLKRKKKRNFAKLVHYSLISKLRTSGARRLNRCIYLPARTSVIPLYHTTRQAISISIISESSSSAHIADRLTIRASLPMTCSLTA